MGRLFIKGEEYTKTTRWLVYDIPLERYRAHHIEPGHVPSTQVTPTIKPLINNIWKKEYGYLVDGNFLKPKKLNLKKINMDIIEELKGMDLYDQDGMRFIDSFLTGFPSCCGAIILHELDFCSNFKFKEITKKLCEVLESNADQNEGVGSFIAISNQDQEELFEDTKWLPVHTFINPNSGNELTYWVLSL